jgi:hypothetical protein
MTRGTGIAIAAALAIAGMFAAYCWALVRLHDKASGIDD